jgi:hypothetical protein
MLKPFIFKVEQYKDGEGYEGYFLVSALDTKHALETLERNESFIKVKNYGGSITINQTNLDDMNDSFSTYRCFELIFDNYN